MNGLGLSLAGANVIMQLSRLPVGHGVAESTVESGSLYAHPVKRTRTTLGYVMIALFGSVHERSELRRQVNGQHRMVRSGPDAAIAYNAFDPELQLWVAACMYRGIEDAARTLYGPTSPSVLDDLYRHCSRFATTLQVPESKWPANRAEFERYWEKALSEVKMDDLTRTYLTDLARLRFLPAPVQMFLGPLHQLVTSGFLPETFRRELGLPWSLARRRFFAFVVGSMAISNKLLPKPLREFPWNLVLWDTRRRLWRGQSFV